MEPSSRYSEDITIVQDIPQLEDADASAAVDVSVPGKKPVAVNGNGMLNKKHVRVKDRLAEARADKWYFPVELRYDLQNVGLSEKIVAETLACAWEYSRCVIPEWTNWNKYLAFIRTIVVAVIAEFRGDLISDGTDLILGYDLKELLNTVFTGTPGHEEMSREFRTFLLISVEKSSKRLDSELFSRYTNALAQSPKIWFRLRDCDALARYTLAGALACNDHKDIWFREDQWQVLSELADTLYDAVAFYKHRAEGETNSTFGYVGGEIEVRGESYRLCREILWALDVAWARDPSKRCVLNFIRFFGGPIHMTTRRYRFVEDGMLIGKPENEHVVAQTRNNFKLWHRVEGCEDWTLEEDRYAAIIAQSERILFPGLSNIIQNSAEKNCSKCYHQAVSEKDDKYIGKFGGIRLCDDCKLAWKVYMETLPVRFTAAFEDVSLEESIQK